MSIYQFNFKNIIGEEVSFKSFEGKVVLIVNTASNCGLTYHYKGLEDLYQEYKDAGLEIIGFPCNQFGKQEPGNNDEIEEFCKVNYGVSFLITEKIDVKGKEQHPLYNWLTSRELNNKKSSSVKWNFQKYLVSPEGKLIDYYYSITTPMSSKITKHLKS